MSTSEQTLERRCGGFSSGTVGALIRAPAAGRPPGFLPGNAISSEQMCQQIMEPGFFDGLPSDVLIVEDDPIIALDFEDTILGFGVKTVRSAGSVAKALDMIADHPPDFALLDVGLIREK